MRLGCTWGHAVELCLCAEWFVSSSRLDHTTPCDLSHTRPNSQVKIKHHFNVECDISWCYMCGFAPGLGLAGLDMLRYHEHINTYRQSSKPTHTATHTETHR